MTLPHCPLLLLQLQFQLDNHTGQYAIVLYSIDYLLCTHGSAVVGDLNLNVGMALLQLEFPLLYI
jgi:hypothetical protein